MLRALSASASYARHALLRRARCYNRLRCCLLLAAAAAKIAPLPPSATLILEFAD